MSSVSLKDNLTESYNLNDRKRVAVIVITHNGKEYLKECFKSLKHQTYKDFDAYLLDNGSTDGSSEYIKQNFPWVKIIRFEKNYGFAGGYNRAIRLVNSKYVALLNDDTRVDSRWLEELVRIIEEDEKIFAVGSKILFYDNPKLINHAGGMITLIGAGIDVGFGELDTIAYSKKRYVGCVCGASMLVNKKVFQELGGFDEDYFAYFEDTDICWRAWLQGYKCVYVPSSVVYHKYGASWGSRLSPSRIFLGTRNKLYNVIKNFELKNLIVAFILAIIFDIIRILILSANYKKKEILAILMAYKDFGKKIRKLTLKRYLIQQSRLVSDGELRKMGLFMPLKESTRIFIDLEVRGDRFKGDSKEFVNEKVDLLED